MAIPSRHEGQQQFVDHVDFLKTVNLPDDCVGDDEIEASAGIDATKVIHQFPIRYSQANGSAVTTETMIVHLPYGDGELVAVEAVLNQAPAAGFTISVDLHKSTGGAAFASMLDSALSFDSDSVALTPEAATVSDSNTYSDGDVLAVVVTAAGPTSGNQGQGLCVVVTVREEPA